MLSPVVGKSKCSQALSQVSYFYDSVKPKNIQHPKPNFFRETGTNFFKTHKTETVPGKLGRMGSIITAYTSIMEAYSWGPIAVKCDGSIVQSNRFVVTNTLTWLLALHLRSFIYEGESNENLKSATKIRTTTGLSCKFQQWYLWFEEWPIGGSTILHSKMTSLCTLCLLDRASSW